MVDEMSDIEAVVLLAFHIENPCEVEVEGKGKNIRYFYINEAEKVLPTLTNPYAKEFLECTISKYRKQKVNCHL